MSSTADTAVAITLGDPAGIGPEVALAAAASLLAASRPTVGLRGRAASPPLARGGPSPRGARVASPVRLALVGDFGVAEDVAARLATHLAIDLELVPCVADELARVLADATVRSPRSSSSRARARVRVVLPVVAPRSTARLRAAERRPGRPNVAAARVAYASIATAVELARAGVVDAICTAPINKGWFDRAGVASTGHTEILAALTGSRGVRLMMALDDLRVVLATTHVALRDVPAALSIDGVAETIAVTARHLTRWWGLTRPRIAVAALNPHAGDGGIYGDEEERIIAPAIARARRTRIDAFGPVPADALFSALGPGCDAVVAMYHDQGLIPVKQADVHRAVNVTLGLPFIRTSPDHGTAFDIAGRGIADARSMEAALALAIELVGRRRLEPDGGAARKHARTRATPSRRRPARGAVAPGRRNR